MVAGGEQTCNAGNPVSTKHLHNICTMMDQRRKLWGDVVQMLYKCFVFAGRCESYGYVLITEKINVTSKPYGTCRSRYTQIKM